MNAKQQAIDGLIHAIIDYLIDHQSQSPGTTLILDKLGSMDLSTNQMSDVASCRSRHDITLQQAIAGITAPELTDIAIRLQRAKPHLAWREDNSNYYQNGADLGDGYRECNLHTILIGPGACGYEYPDFILGVFVLGPRTLYRDHRHAAPELYLNLSNRSGWRLHENDWQDYPAGSIIWNATREVHATKVYEQPFISVFAWLKDVQEPCELVLRDDWSEIEESLQQII